MRVGVVAPDLRETGGVGAKALFVARSLQRHLGASVQLVSLATSRRDGSSILLHQPRTWTRRLCTRFSVDEFTVDHVGAIGAEIEIARYGARRALLDLVDGCDVVHVVCGTPAWGYAVRGFRGSLIVHFASFARHERLPDPAERRTALGRWRALMTSAVSRLERVALRRADAVITVNDTRRREAQALVGPDTLVETVHTGVDTEHFSPGPYRDDGYWLNVGRLNDPRKNLPLLLRAYAAARARASNLPRLVLAGPCAPAPSSWQLVSSLGLTGSVQYLGPLGSAALAETYRGASAFVLSSDEEGLGIVLIEAMASGLPVVATACVGPPEIITDGCEGLLTPVRSVAALADAIVRVSTDPALRRRMSHAARYRAVEECSLDRAGARLCRIYGAAAITSRLSSASEAHVVSGA
jgi:glycosyltransferase involved in cell wall biosynthesis